MQFMTRDRVREVDRLAVSELKIPSLILMENAARGIADAVRETVTNGQTLILCGAGNNGGDGLAVMRQLAAIGIIARCGLVCPGRALSVDAAANLKILQAAGVEIPTWSADESAQNIADVSERDCIVDAILGTGVHGVVRSPTDRIIAAINKSPAKVIAADIPSGMNCDTGLPCGVCVRAARTVTFVAAKTGFQNPAALQYTGQITVCNIGIPSRWLHSRFPELNNNADVS
jgi:NAD(P)H-hydrate epimerase